MNSHHYTKAEIEAVLALDDKRTPGELRFLRHPTAQGIPVCIDVFDGGKYLKTIAALKETNATMDDGRFFAAAPKMIKIIRQQQEQIACLNELLVTAHNNCNERQQKINKLVSRIAFLEGQVKGLTRPLGKTEGINNAR
jgi:hypothetical protein